jgi:hypothetical protein
MFRQLMNHRVLEPCLLVWSFGGRATANVVNLAKCAGIRNGTAPCGQLAIHGYNSWLPVSRSTALHPSRLRIPADRL